MSEEKNNLSKFEEENKKKLNNLLHFFKTIIKTEIGKELTEKEKKKVLKKLEKENNQIIYYVSKWFLYNGNQSDSLETLKKKTFYNRLRKTDIGTKFHFWF